MMCQIRKYWNLLDLLNSAWFLLTSDFKWIMCCNSHCLHWFFITITESEASWELYRSRWQSQLIGRLVDSMTLGSEQRYVLRTFLLKVHGNKLFLHLYVQVLKEADETVAEVLMMQDGSWKCVVPCEDKCTNGIDGAINDLSEVGKVCVNDEEASVINLCCESDFEEEFRAEAMNCADAEPPDRKPSSQVLQVLIGDCNQSRGATPATQAGLRVDSSLLRPSSGPSTVSNFRDISATGVQGSTGFPGPLRSVPITSGLSGCIRPILSERQGYSQPGLQPPAIVQALPALHSQSYYTNLGSHGSPGTHLGSTGAHVNSLASSSGHTASLQLPHSLMVSDMDTSPREATGAVSISMHPTGHSTYLRSFSVFNDACGLFMPHLQCTVV